MARTPAARSPEHLVKHRLDNLTLVTQAYGSKALLCKKVGISDATVSYMANGRKDFSRDLAEKMEEVLGLPDAWFDVAHTLEDVPESVWAVLGGVGGKAPREPKDKSVKGPVGRKAQPVQAGLDLPPAREVPRLPAALPSALASEPLVAAGGAPASPTLTQAPVSAPAEAAAPVAPQATSVTKPAKQPVVAAPAAASAASSTPAPAPAALAPVSVPAPVAPAAAAPAAPVEVSHLLGNAQLSPMAEALIKTIARRDVGGHLTEDHLYVLLGFVSGRVPGPDVSAALAAT